MDNTNEHQSRGLANSALKKRALWSDCVYHSAHIMLLLLFIDNTSALCYLLFWTCFKSIHPAFSYPDPLSNALFVLSFFPTSSHSTHNLIFLLLPFSPLLSFPLFFTSLPLIPFLLRINVKPHRVTYTPTFFADLFNLLNPFAYLWCNFPPRLHLNNTNPVYICQLRDSTIFMNIIEHIPAVRRCCQQGHKNKD